MSQPADRSVLPIPDRPYDGPVFEDAKDPAAKFPPIEPLRPPAGAPNVLVELARQCERQRLAVKVTRGHHFVLVRVWDRNDYGVVDDRSKLDCQHRLHM